MWRINFAKCRLRASIDHGILESKHVWCCGSCCRCWCHCVVDCTKAFVFTKECKWGSQGCHLQAWQGSTATTSLVLGYGYCATRRTLCGAHSPSSSSSYPADLLDAWADLYDADKNPNGRIILALAEQRSNFPMMAARIRAVAPAETTLVGPCVRFVHPPSCCADTTLCKYLPFVSGKCVLWSTSWP